MDELHEMPGVLLRICAAQSSGISNAAEKQPARGEHDVRTVQSAYAKSVQRMQRGVTARPTAAL